MMIGLLLCLFYSLFSEQQWVVSPSLKEGGLLGAGGSKDVGDNVREAKATKNDVLSQQLVGLLNVSSGEGLAVFDALVDNGLAKIEALSRPHLDVKVLPISSWKTLLTLHLCCLASKVTPLAVVKRLLKKLRIGLMLTMVGVAVYS